MPALSQFFDISNDLYCILNSAGICQKVNRTFLYDLGYTNDEVIGHSFYGLIHPDDVAGTVKEYEDVKEGKRNCVIHNRLRNKSGDYKWVSWSSIAYNSDDDMYYASCQSLSGLEQFNANLVSEKVSWQTAITRVVIETLEKERDKISEDLHDNVNQIITSAKLNVEYLQEMYPTGNHLLKKSSELLQLAINEIRAICNRLSTKSLEISNLYDSIRNLIDTYSTSKKLHVKFASKGVRNITLTKEVKLAIYRIVQEQLTNIIKYAGTDQVQVTLNHAAGVLSLNIKDQGKGFDLNAHKAGNGIMNMKARAESLEGWLQIESAPGLGCSLSAFFPLTEKHKD